MARLRVYGISIGWTRAIVAAPNMKAAAEAFGTTIYKIRNYCSETNNEKEVELAISKPGQVFERLNRWHDSPWHEVPRWMTLRST